jgi:predicted amidohydrolase
VGQYEYCVDANGIAYDGGSPVISSTGEVIRQMAKQEYAEVSIDSSEVERVRRTWPFLPEVASPTSRGPFGRGIGMPSIGRAKSSFDASPV